jgi:hypothetical protein
MKSGSGDKIFRVVVLTGLGLVVAGAETVSCGGSPPHEGADARVGISCPETPPRRP